MTKQIFISRAAEQDQHEIARYSLAQSGDALAVKKLFSELEAAFSRALEFPKSGRAVDHLLPTARRLVVRNDFLVFYRPVDGGILIIRVLHAKRLIAPADIGQHA